MEQMQHVRFSHPLYHTALELDLPVSTTFRELTGILRAQGFLPYKPGGYQYIIDDRLCARASSLGDYLPTPAPAVLDVRVHGLLTILV